jgi:hypothetical protein
MPNDVHIHSHYYTYTNQVCQSGILATVFYTYTDQILILCEIR